MSDTPTFTVHLLDPSGENPDRWTVEGVEDVDTTWGDRNEVKCRFPDSPPQSWVGTGLTIERVVAEHAGDESETTVQVPAGTLETLMSNAPDLEQLVNGEWPGEPTHECDRATSAIMSHLEKTGQLDAFLSTKETDQ